MRIYKRREADGSYSEVLRYTKEEHESVNFVWFNRIMNDTRKVLDDLEYLPEYYADNLSYHADRIKYRKLGLFRGLEE